MQTGFIIPNQLDIISEMKILFIKNLEIIRFLFRVDKVQISERLSYLKSIFETETTDALRLYCLLKNLYLLNPKSLVFTHEGYPWEKMSIKSAKEFNKKKFCALVIIHIMINKYNFGLLRKMMANTSSDVIWQTEKFQKNSN